MSSDPSSIPLQIVLIVGIMVLNALVVLTNTAFEAVSRSKIKQMVAADEDSKAAGVDAILEKPSKYRFTNRILNFFLLTVAIWIVIGLPWNDILSLLVFLLIVIPLGEFFPRKLAQQHSIKIALSLAGVQRGIVILLTPLMVILSGFTNIFLVLFRQQIKPEDSGYSEEEVMSILEAGQESGEIKEEGKKMINSIFQFDDELAYEIMTPRTDVFLIDIEDPTEEYLDKLMELRYSRIPVCERESDNIIGILHIKDYLIRAKDAGFDKVDIREILRKPYFVPETKNIDALFFELQKEKQHIAILIDEYGGFSGIVTMEDIIEEIVGDIDDEYDEEDLAIEKIDDNDYYVNGNVYLDDLHDEVNLKLESENSETIGGFIIDLLGEIPDDGNMEQTVDYDSCVFTILSVKERRIEKIRLHIRTEEEIENMRDLEDVDGDDEQK